MNKSIEIPNNQTIRELINDSFQIDLPITGGYGKSVDDAIILELTDENEYVATEYEVLEFLGYIRSVKWKLTKQKLVYVGDQIYDQIQIMVCDLVNSSKPYWVEEFYFDITECFNNNASLLLDESE